MYERKRNVVNAAQRLFIEKGFQNTSIQDILEEAKNKFHIFQEKNLILFLENQNYRWENLDGN